MPFQLVDPTSDAIPIHPVARNALGDWLGGRSAAEQAWVKGNGFKGDPGSVCILPSTAGSPVGVVLGVEATDHPEGGLWSFAGLSESLPPGTYRIEAALDARAADAAALGWALGTYAFARYKARKASQAQLVWPDEADRNTVTATAEATFLGRDLINTPAGDLGPAELAAAAKTMADRFGASFSEIVGDDLLAQNYPAIHAVGRASAKPPRLIELRWGDPSHPKVTLVGKGVCFDSGGLDIKPSGGMKLMKKDMGGAAIVLSLAQLVMATAMKVRLRVLVPAVENMIAGNAFHPLDILPTRKGLTVEVGNTDAEGRLILCDALAEADSEKPDLLVDCATLTGAARVALGPDLPVVYTRQDAVAEAMARLGMARADPIWRLPLWSPYRKYLDCKIADLSSTGDGPFAGSITAALYLAEFVAPETNWVHIDVYAWSPRARPGRPEGGEPQTLRMLHALIAERAG